MRIWRKPNYCQWISPVYWANFYTISFTSATSITLNDWWSHLLHIIKTSWKQLYHAGCWSKQELISCLIRLYSWTSKWWQHTDTHCCLMIPAIFEAGWSIHALSITSNSVMDVWTWVSWTLYHWQNLISLHPVLPGIQGERCYCGSIIVSSKFINKFGKLELIYCWQGVGHLILWCVVLFLANNNSYDSFFYDNNFFRLYSISSWGTQRLTLIMFMVCNWARTSFNFW